MIIRDHIFSEKLRSFLKCFRPHENVKTAFLGSSSLKGVFEKLRSVRDLCGR